MGRKLHDISEHGEENYQRRLPEQEESDARFDAAFELMQTAIERSFDRALKRLEDEYLDGDWVRDFNSKRAHVQWRVANRNYPSPPRGPET